MDGGIAWIVASAAVALLALGGAVLVSRRGADEAGCAGCGRALLAGWPRCPFCGRRRAAPSLAITRGPLQGQVVELAGGEVTIGSVAGNTVVLADPAVSRQHLVVRRRGDRFELLDLGSTNGVYVNGRRCRRKTLAPGDALAIGNTEIVFEPAAEPGD